MKILIIILSLFMGTSCSNDTTSSNDTTNSNESNVSQVKHEKNESHDDHDGYTIGSKVEDFHLKSVDGSIVAMSDFKEAKGIIVIFSCNHCPFVVMYEDRMNDLHDKFNDMGYPIVAINSNDDVQYPSDSYEAMIVRAQEKGFEFQYIHDDTQNVAKRFGAKKTPHVYLLSKKGEEFTVEYIGAIDDNAQDASSVKVKYLENAIASLDAGEEIETKETKAIGCSIKFRK